MQQLKVDTFLTGKVDCNCEALLCLPGQMEC